MFYIDGFGFWKNAIKKCSLDVNLLYIPVEDSCNVKNITEGFKVLSWGGGFVVVNEVPLCKAFCNILNFISWHLTSVIVFMFADKLSFQRALMTGNFWLENKNKNLQVREDFQFIPSTSNLVFSFRWCESRCP